MKVIATAPSRISLAGGGSDTAPYCEEYGGAVISLAINLRQHYSCEDKYIEMDTPEYCVFDGVIGAGLGSSAAYYVVKAAVYLQTDKDSIAQAAWFEEVVKGKKYGGKQDQWASAYGGFNFMLFSKDVEVFPFAKSTAEKLMPSLALFYTGGTRDSSKLQNKFKHPTRKQIKALNKGKMLAYEMAKYIKRDDIESTGELLDEVWQYKKESNTVTTPKIDAIYKKAKKLGAWGGKLLGAGGCGYMVFMVSPERRKRLIKDLGVQHIDFSPCFNGVEVRQI